MTVILRALRVLFLFLVLLSYYLVPGGVVLELHQTVFKTTDSLRLSPPACSLADLNRRPPAHKTGALNP